MRPDALHFRNTNELNSLEFSPGKLIYHRIPRWIAFMLLLQAALSVALWAALHMLPVDAWTASLAAQFPAAPPEQPSTAPLSTFAASFGRIVRHDHFTHVACLIVAQLVATIVLRFAVVPQMSKRLQRHGDGLKDVFEAIRGMAMGLVPKPLSAGRPGEAGILALAFNDMTARLLSQKNELIEANQTLEKKVHDRTRELREAAEAMERMAAIDALTGLANRRALADHGQRKFNIADYDGSDLVCVMVDLDNFKKVNDTYGHQRGDDLIKLAADTLRKCSRAQDLAARLGGDEFVVIMPLEGLSTAATIAERLQSEFRGQVNAMFTDGKLERLPSMSIGITSRKTVNAKTFEDLMVHADAALYRAKDAGKGRAVIDEREPALA